MQRTGDALAMHDAFGQGAVLVRTGVGHGEHFGFVRAKQPDASDRRFDHACPAQGNVGDSGDIGPGHSAASSVRSASGA